MFLLKFRGRNYHLNCSSEIIKNFVLFTCFVAFVSWIFGANITFFVYLVGLLLVTWSKLSTEPSLDELRAAYAAAQSPSEDRAKNLYAQSAAFQEQTSTMLDRMKHI